MAQLESQGLAFILQRPDEPCDASAQVLDHSWTCSRLLHTLPARFCSELGSALLLCAVPYGADLHHNWTRTMTGAVKTFSCQLLQVSAHATALELDAEVFCVHAFTQAVKV